MDRRSYLIGISALVVTTSGCMSGDTQSSGRRLEVTNSRNVNAAVVSQSASPPEYTATIENTGMSGECRVELLWPADGDQSGDVATSTTIGIESGGRQSVTLTADRPSSARRYGFQTKSIDFAADIKNRGEDTAVFAQLVKEPSGVVLDEKEREITSGDTITVQFQVPEGYSGEYAVQTTLAEV